MYIFQTRYAAYAVIYAKSIAIARITSRKQSFHTYRPYQFQSDGDIPGDIISLFNGFALENGIHKPLYTASAVSNTVLLLERLDVRNTEDLNDGGKTS